MAPDFAEVGRYWLDEISVSTVINERAAARVRNEQRIAERTAFSREFYNDMFDASDDVRTTICNVMRRTSHISRKLCADNARKQSDSKNEFLTTKIFKTSPTPDVEVGSFRMPSIDIFKKLFHKKASSTVLNAATPSF